MNTKDIEEKGFQRTILIGALLVTVLLVVAVSVLTTPIEGLNTELRLIDVLFDRNSQIYPFTVQNLMWVFFFVCAGEIFVRWNRAKMEFNQSKRIFLSEDPNTLYRSKDLVPVYKKLIDDVACKDFFLQRLLMRVVVQFQITKSSDQANSILNSSLELIQHEVDLKYNMIRYWVWLIPTLGFIGTVIGISFALSAAGDMPDPEDFSQMQDWVATITIKLGIAFNTTLVALIMSSILVFFMNKAQGREERALNTAGQYCLEKLINRLTDKD